MSLDPIETVRKIFEESVLVQQRFATGSLPGVVAAATAISRALVAGRKVLAFGNGGSASDAEHLVAELVGRFEGERRSLRSLPGTAVDYLACFQACMGNT